MSISMFLFIVLTGTRRRWEDPSVCLLLHPLLVSFPHSTITGLTQCYVSLQECDAEKGGHNPQGRFSCAGLTTAVRICAGEIPERLRQSFKTQLCDSLNGAREVQPER